MTIAPLSHRDRAVLRAVAAGRCELTGGPCAALRIDGLTCCDQFVGGRLTAAGLIADGAGPALLTESGRALLAAA